MKKIGLVLLLFFNVSFARQHYSKLTNIIIAGYLSKRFPTHSNSAGEYLSICLFPGGQMKEDLIVKIKTVTSLERGELTQIEKEQVPGQIWYETKEIPQDNEYHLVDDGTRCKRTIEGDYQIIKCTTVVPSEHLEKKRY